MIVSFTGTQEGMTQYQKDCVKDYLDYLCQLEPTEFHHGDCIGADAEAHDIVLALGIPIHIHPPDISGRRAFKKNADFRHSPKPYLKRNMDMAQVCHILIATPKENIEIIRSGTWATIRYARKFNKEVIIILPNGQEII